MSRKIVLLSVTSLAVLSLMACGKQVNTKDGAQVTTIAQESTTEDALPVFAKVAYYTQTKLDEYQAYAAKNPDLSMEDVVTYVNIGLNRDFYSDSVTISNPDNILVLCNKYNKLPDDYVPADLVEVTTSNSAVSGLKLRKEAAEAFDKLCAGAKTDGYTILGASGYRSFTYQQGLYNNYVKQDGVTSADTYSARAGYSEHQTGLAIDVKNKTAAYDKFGTTPEYQWAKDNVYKYGFIIRYLPETIHITGYQSEEWHFRYVGVETAAKVHEMGITYDEYCARGLNK